MITGWWHFFVGYTVAVAFCTATQGRWWVAVINLVSAVVMVALQTSPQSWGLR